MTFGENLTMIIRFYTLLETSIGAISRLKSFSENVKQESSEGEDIVPPKERPADGKIDISGVSAAYEDNGEAPHEHLALDNLRLSIAPGERVAICGRSGSGKSSLLLLFLRLLDPVPRPKPTGPSQDHQPSNNPLPQQIAIDSLPLTSISRNHLRARILALPQEPVFLPSGTPTRTNLDPQHAASESDCVSALQAVSLWEFISARGGLDAPLSPDTLSQGQKQLFNLARAILRRRLRARDSEGGILLLDMQRVIMREFAGYTIVMVSHRLGMVMGFDRVVVMDAGRIVEMGRPAKLAETEGSKFRGL
ncbi:P-loop containing nucleoside triphosphate hydrolase protein [Parathielavia appendiculata]|uniref:P-loop containing nucleoside triphosphate hydrolase protein n=1 Tax=Parathielavia appendiculata TaxID=2587402 RepID=A0AAN6Z1Q1_9PEZI|nr:P-loop containing nucleoside triphosphate hydrolase protein [Parathielavia appendiculata]